MFVYRIANTHFITDLTAEGAYLFGGRWNRKEQRVLYTATSIALAAWEVFVHLPEDIELSENSFTRISIEVPDECGIINYKDFDPRGDITRDRLLKDPNLCFEISDGWISDNRFLCMQVPSFAVEGEYNYLINSSHPFIDQVKIIELVPYTFDRRAFGKNIVKNQSDPTGLH